MIEQTIQVGNLQLRGRIVMPPMATEQADGGLITPGMGAYYAARAKNPEIGLIITEHSYIEMRGKASRGQVSIAEDEAIEGLSTITKAIHAAAEGIKVFAQINHAGGYTSRDITGTEPVSASAGILKQEPARALTKDEILQIEELFAQAARRAQLAGYDGVEIHSAHSYLLNQFYSPLTNHRMDEYGCQTMENRLRMHLETIQKVREKVGENFPIAVRLGGCDYTPGGSTIEDSVEASLLLQKAGVDLLDLSGGMCRYILEGVSEPGWFGQMTRQIKQQVNVPVLLTGGIKTRAEAETLLEQGAADLIGIGRALLKEPLLK